MFYFLNEDHSYTPCDLETWAHQLENMKRQIACDTVDGCFISTVWLGCDHNHFGGKPLVFETMIFRDGSDIYMDRYSTWDDALEGHQKAIQWIEEGCKNDNTL